MGVPSVIAVLVRIVVISVVDRTIFPDPACPRTTAWRQRESPASGGVKQ